MTSHTLRSISMSSCHPGNSCTNLLCISCVKVVRRITFPVAIERHCSCTWLHIAIACYTFTCVTMLSKQPGNSGADFLRISRIEMVMDGSIVVAIERYRSCHLCVVYVALYTLRCVAVVTYCFWDCCSNLVNVCGVEVVVSSRAPVTIERNQSCILRV